MSRDLVPDDDLARRLPLPLAQLYRLAHNAKTPLDRHNAAYCLWEAATLGRRLPMKLEDQPVFRPERGQVESLKGRGLPAEETFGGRHERRSGDQNPNPDLAPALGQSGGHRG